jgi:hypothetical protein
MLDGVERHLLFTLNAIDGIQDKFGEPLEEAMKRLVAPETADSALKSILMVLLNDEVEHLSYKGRACELEAVDEKEVGWMLTKQNIEETLFAVLRAYGVDLPEPDEEEADPNQKSRRKK